MSVDSPIAGPGPGSMAQSHTKPAPRMTLAAPLLPTITFIASWRGQLLICIVSLALGAVYFLVRDPLRQWSRRRKERLSQVRMEELMSMESEEVDKGNNEVDSAESKEKRGRKKRRGPAGLLKVPGVDGASSVDGSPVPTSSTSSSPVPRRRSSAANSPRPRGSGLASLPEAVETSFQTSTLSRMDKLPVQTAPGHAQTALGAPSLIIRPTTPPLPCQIPLPDSPIAGPSRSAPSITSSDVASLDGDTSESNSTRPRASSSLSNGGFSIIPEAGYLPSSALQSSKKKKRKGKPTITTTPLENLDSSAGASPMINGTASPFSAFASGSAMKLPATPRTPSSSRHARKASLTRPVGADLEDLLTEREKMIDALRADIGTAKAEEAKAIEELSRTKAESERMGVELEGMKRMGNMSDHDGRRREAELSARLSQISSQYTATLHRLGALENFVRESGLQPPSTLPSVPNGSFLSPTTAQQLSPPSPFGMSFAASPHTPSHTMGYIPYPSPGMYPSPMLHPNFHPQHLHSPRAGSPGLYRRASTAGGEDAASLAGAILPGAYGYHASLFPSANHLPGQPSPKVNGHSNGTGLNAADKRRISIESSVLKRKPDHPGGSSRSDTASSHSSQKDEAIPEGDEDTISTNGVEGLGVGDIPRPRMGSPENGTLSPQSTDDPSSPSHPSSPSPLNRAAVLLTPASADLFQRLQENGHVDGGHIRSAASMSSNSGSSTDLPGLNGIKMISEGEKGNVYYSTLAPVPSMESLEDATLTNGIGANGIHPDGVEGEGRDEKREEYVPMFASLAHTPAQLAEIQRMREEALRNKKTKENGVNGVEGLNGVGH